MFSVKSALMRSHMKMAVRRRIPLQLRRHHARLHPVSWEKPEQGVIKLNFDGSSRGKARRASIGGVFRNHNAEFLLGYAEPIGRANSVVAELAALRRGLELVLEKGWNDIWLEGDAMAALEIVEGRREADSSEAQSHAGRIQAIIADLRRCVVSHVYREGNRTADRLAAMGHRLKSPAVWVDPPNQVLRLVIAEAEGKVVFRRQKP